MKKLLLSLIAIALFPTNVLADVVVGRTTEGTIFFYGLSPSETYYLSYVGVPMKRRLIANECGVLKVAESKTRKVADSYKVGSQTFQTWDTEIPDAPKCSQGALKSSPPQSFYVTRTVNSKRDNSTSLYWDFYVTGLEPFSGHDVDYLENPTQYHSGKSDRCGIAKFNKNATTKNFSFSPGDLILLWDRAITFGIVQETAANSLPIGLMPICKNSRLYLPR